MRDMSDVSGRPGRLCRLLSADEGSARFETNVDCSVAEFLQGLGLSRGGRAAACAEGRVTRRGATLAAGSRLAAGDEVVLRLAVPAGEARASGGALADGRVVPGRLRVVAEDAFLLAVDKPAGIIVHGDGTGGVTLTDLVRAHLATEGRWRAVACAQAVQRLDEGTSGLVLFSLSKDFQPAFDALVAGHALHKRYLAVVEGGLPAGTRTIDAPIARDRHDARRMRVSRTGKPSVTRVARLDVRGGRSLVACELGTGRRHQIRVHLASIGHPIVGDVLYGGRPSPAGLCLHALEEEFDHPVTGEHLRLSTDWPGRFSSLFGPRAVDWAIL